MKKIFFVIPLSLILFSSGCDQKDKPDEVKESFDRKNELRTETPYKDGVRHGIQKTFYPDGKLYSEVNFTNGNMNGVMKIYFPNGNVKVEANYKDGLLDGITKLYYENGNVMREQQYEKNKMVRDKKYSISGTLEFDDKL